MAIEMRQQMKLTQQLVMTPQLQQAIKLLQLSRLELQDVVRQELEENPVLEETPDYEQSKDVEQLEMSEKEESPAAETEKMKEVEAGEQSARDLDWETYLEGYNYSAGEQYYDDGEERPSYENVLSRRATLFDHLMWQLNMGHFDDPERKVGEEIIGNIDDDGYIRTPLDEIASACEADEALVEQTLKKIQEFDPMGVAARNLRECLLLQLRQLGMADTPVEALVKDHLRDLEARKYKVIAKALGISIDDVVEASRVIAHLDPKPGLVYSGEDVQYISADIFVYKVGDEFMVLLNDEGLPNLRVNPVYSEDGKSGGQFDSKTEEYLNDKIRAAQWLIKSIHQRQRTIFKAAKSIVKFQRDFLDHGIEYLRPLVLRDVAEDIGMHESTISRVTTNKYIQTPQGLYELKYFFNSGISTADGESIASESVKKKIREIIAAEDARRPLSDQRIAEILSGQTINIARRTVTKYREMMKIGSSSERKRMY